MTPEYLREIEELYHAAREDKNVLASADPELRLEVESLLSHESDTLPTLSIGDALDDGEADPTAPMIVPGTQLGSYIIERSWAQAVWA